MSHRIPDDAIERLATMAGVPTLEAWRADLANANDRIETQLAGTVKEAWDRCFPTWLDVGRVQDLSRSIRVPKYLPRYGNQLGQAFACQFRQEDKLLANILHNSPIDSFEYLIACDLLDMIVCSDFDNPDVSYDRIFQLTFDIPLVIQQEVSQLQDLQDATSIGDLLRKLYRAE